AHRQAELAPEDAGLSVHAGVPTIDLDAGTVIGLVTASRQPCAEHLVPGLADLVGSAHELRDRDLASGEIDDIDPLVGGEVGRPARDALPGLRTCLLGLRSSRWRALQRAAPPSRQAVALMPNRARKARANVAADENPWSSATSSTLWSGCAVRATAARSILSRWMKPNSVSPVVA